FGSAGNAMAIWQDLVDDHGFRSAYASVKRFLVKLRGSVPLEARVVIQTAPGEEAQVDNGDGPIRVGALDAGRDASEQFVGFSTAHRASVDLKIPEPQAARPARAQ